MSELDQLILNLKAKPEVDAVFITGSTATKENSSSSDIDLIVVLENNTAFYNIRSVYQLTDGIFTDIFFFHVSEIEELKEKEHINASYYDGMLVSWLQKADICFDKSKKTSQIFLIAKELKIEIFEQEINQNLNDISYDSFKCQRYFSSGQNDYLDALELMLPNAVIRLLSAYLILQGIPWRGEKAALIFIKKSCNELYRLYFSFINCSSLDERMEKYNQMINLVLPNNLSLFDYKTPLALSRGNSTNMEIKKLNKFWKELSSVSQ